MDNSTGDKDRVSNHGKHKLDATMIVQNITYPNGFGSLNTAERRPKRVLSLFGLN